MAFLAIPHLWKVLLPSQHSEVLALCPVETTSLNEDVQPPKTNMDPEKGPLRKGKHLHTTNHQLLGVHVSFQGYISIFQISC